MSISASHASPLAPVVRRLAEKIRIPEARFGLEPLSLRLRPQWDAYVRCHSRGSFFHTIAWLESVAEVFKHDPHHLLARCDGRIVGVLPLSQVRSRLGGTMLVSVPYAVGGGVLSDNDAVAEGLKALALKVARQCGANVIELRSEVRQFDDIDNIDNIERYVTFKRELPERAEDVLGWLPRKARAAARSARNKHGLRAEFGTHHLRAVWRLYCRSMRRLGSICYPLRFFEALTERAGANAFVQVVCAGPRVVGGLLSFRFGDTFLPYFVGYDERCKQMSVSNFIYLTAMERAVESRCRVFDFGRSRIDNQGSYDFKRFHGFKPQPLGYQRLRLGEEHAPELTPSDPRFRLARAIWPHLPLPVSIRLGTWASHHIPG